MSKEDLDKVVSHLSDLGRDFNEGMTKFNKSLDGAMKYRKTVSDDVGKGLDMVNTASLALIKSGEALERVGDNLLIITDSHAKQMEKLGQKFDTYADEARKSQQMLGEMLGRQTLMSDGIAQLCAKIDTTDARQIETDDKVGGHETRIKVIESLREQTKDSKSGLISTVSVLIAASALFITAYQALKTPPPPPTTNEKIRYESKPK